LHLVVTILAGDGQSDKGIVGGSYYETVQMRSEWCALKIPRYSGLVGVEWDGIDRLPEAEKS
jgi:hypothetical protein